MSPIPKTGGGRHNGATLPDHLLRWYRQYPFTTTVVPTPVYRGFETLDAAHECEHGRLPADPTPRCGCWPESEGR